MNKPPAWATREESLLLLNAYIDNELDTAAALEFEQRLRADAALKVEYDRLVQLKSAFAAHLTKDRASADLRQRIAAIAAPQATLPMPKRLEARTYNWRQMAAAVIAAACVASGSTYFGLRAVGPSNDIAAIVAGHQRALLAAAPFEVASSDRHTVKPWFDGKLALSPKVIDLASAGFALAGGRADLIDGRAVPAIVYRHRQHVISVIAVPYPGDRDTGSPPRRATRDGYSVLTWDGLDFKYSAVSDVAAGELEDFVRLWRATSSDE
jgi:anti-sigma factor RsiW